MSDKVTDYLFPVGVSDFRELITSRDPNGRKNLFVDKSLFIQSISSDGSKVILITRPRRFGKTLMLSMLRYFLSAEVSGESTAGLFSGLKISQDASVMAHQGKYPVVFVSFKDIKDDNFESAKTRIADAIRELYAEFRHIISSLEAEEQDTFSRILRMQATDIELETSLKSLTKYLYQHYKVLPYVLIDEYDTPIQSAYANDYYAKMTNFMRGMFGSCLKDNTYITKAVLTGITRVAKEGLFSGVNNLEMYSLFDTRYKEYFGFTEEEVNDLFTRSGIKLNAAEIKNWYNGYQCDDLLVYNPWSIIKCLNKNGLISSYWINSSDNKLATDLILKEDYEIKEKFEQLLRLGEITELVDEHLVYGELKRNRAAVWSLLLMAGYLKATSYTIKGRKYLCTLKLPNKEVADFYSEMIEEWLSNTHGSIWFENFLQDLLDGAIDKFEEKLQVILLETFAFQDVNRKNQENFYHGFVLGLIAALKQTHEIRSNRESGLGFYDILIIPKDRTGRGIILELKAVAKNDNLEKTAKQALQQIQDNKYHVELMQRGIKNILALGIAFSHKSVKVAYQK